MGKDDGTCTCVDGKERNGGNRSWLRRKRRKGGGMRRRENDGKGGGLARGLATSLG